jgi:AraC-like DNA-binding protein
MKRWMLLSDEACGDGVIGETHQRLHRLIRHVVRQGHEPLSLGRAARICGFEKTYFCRFFQAQTGLTFSEWIRRVRIDRAKNLLERGHGSIAEVALFVRYKDITTFERHFKRCEKVTPVQYLKQRQTARLKAKPQ